MRQRRADRRVVVAALVALLAGAVVLGARWLGGGAPDPCDVGRDLADARMLDAASAAYDRGECDAALRRQVNNERNHAQLAFARGAVYDAAAKEAHATADASNGELETAARRRARRADATTVAAIVEGLRRDPFDAVELDRLSVALARLGERRSHAASIRLCRSGRTWRSEGLVGGMLIESGLLVPARELIGQLVMQARTDDCGSALQQLRRQHASAVAHARYASWLRARDADDEARRHDAIALRADSSLLAAQAQLETAAADRDTRAEDAAQLVAGVPGWLKASWESILAVICALVLGSVLLLLASRRAAWRWDWVRRALTHPGRGRFARQVVGIGIVVRGEGEPAGGGRANGSDVAGLISSVLDQPPPGISIDRYPGMPPRDFTSLTTAGDVLGATPGGALAELLMRYASALLAPRVVEVTVRLVRLEGGVDGIAAEMVCRQRVVGSTILRADEFDPEPLDGGDVRRLAVPTALWALEALRPLISRHSPEPPGVWRGVALNAAGRAWMDAGDLRRARWCYVRALVCDPELLPARSNLAVVEIRCGAYPAALVLTGRVEATFAAAGHGLEARWPGLREVARYNSVRATVYDAERSRDAGRLEGALAEARALLARLLDERAPSAAQLRSFRLGAVEPAHEMRFRLWALEGAALQLFASVLVRTSPTEARAAIEGALASDAPAPPQLSRKQIKRLTSPGGGRSRAGSSIATTVVEKYLRRHDDRSARSQYNLACFYSLLLAVDAGGPMSSAERGCCATLAFEALEVACEDASLCRWAVDDPSLRPLRRHFAARWRTSPWVTRGRSSGSPTPATVGGNGSS